MKSTVPIRSIFPSSSVGVEGIISICNVLISGRVGVESTLSIRSIFVSTRILAECAISYCHILISSRGSTSGSIESLVSDSHIVVGSIRGGSTRTSVECLVSDSCVGLGTTVGNYLVGCLMAKCGMTGAYRVESKSIISIGGIIVSCGVGVEGIVSICGVRLSSSIK